MSIYKPIGHTLFKKGVDIDFVICEHKRGMGGSIEMRIDPWSFIFEFARGVFKKFDFFDFFHTKTVEN